MGQIDPTESPESARLDPADAENTRAAHTLAALTLAALTAQLAERDAEIAHLVAERERSARVESSRRELVAFITHDLRTPLSGIVSMSEALEDRMAPDPALYHSRIRDLAGQLSDMVDDLFEVSKIETGTLKLTLEPVSLVDVVSDAVADHRAISAGREIRVLFPGSAAGAPAAAGLMVMADPRELARAVSNLLLNALQHTPPGAPVTVTADAVDGRPRISVVDSGLGIPSAELASVFEAGWRGTESPTPVGGAASTGAGLGLAIVRGIARAHRGEVEVRNVPGGCRFDLLLPRDSAVVAA